MPVENSCVIPLQKHPRYWPSRHREGFNISFGMTDCFQAPDEIRRTDSKDSHFARVLFTKGVTLMSPNASSITIVIDDTRPTTHGCHEGDDGAGRKARLSSPGVRAPCDGKHLSNQQQGAEITCTKTADKKQWCGGCRGSMHQSTLRRVCALARGRDKSTNWEGRTESLGEHKSDISSSPELHTRSCVPCPDLHNP